ARGPTGTRRDCAGGPSRRGVGRREHRGTRSCPFLRVSNYTAAVFAYARFGAMGPEEPEATFKVSDRRRRSSDDEPPHPAVSRPEPAAARPEESRKPMPEPVPGPGGEPERSLVGLFMMLASSAVVSLGDAPDPLTGQRRVYLAHAADASDLLILLREKTERNRSPEDNHIREVVLYDVQLRYVHAMKLP